MPQPRRHGSSVTDRPIFVDVLVIVIDILALLALAMRGRALRRSLALAVGLDPGPDGKPDADGTTP